ncbi:hypothetical protein P691DRAFT_808406 [Macrolepiota fuliginosa MF-IS2]|uniref:Uncharacterized protein n=1 Tax=Macrolepiota fuliginosa MF-IS2 TaxID=1400762 RepID=A0A9P5XI87_9AGAR|nr:hypothetical protein P691DRAFT_808406 [Macrolepiota fuliginosa MF-IS2]
MSSDPSQTQTYPNIVLRSLVLLLLLLPIIILSVVTRPPATPLTTPIAVISLHPPDNEYLLFTTHP